MLSPPQRAQHKIESGHDGHIVGPHMNVPAGFNEGDDARLRTLLAKALGQQLTPAPLTQSFRHVWLAGRAIDRSASLPRVNPAGLGPVVH